MRIFQIFLLTLFIFGSAFTTAPVKTTSDGVQFQNLTFNEALEVAKNENKMVFVNVYALWCGACDLMKEATYKSKDVANVVNNNFIPISLDVEQEEGMAFAKKYEIDFHPLVMIISPDGKVQKSIFGYKKDQVLLEELKDFL